MNELEHVEAQWEQLLEAESGMPSPGLVYDRLRQALSLARREPLAVTLMLIRWAPVAEQGPEALQQLDLAMSERVLRAVRASDSVGWFGDGLLAVILPNANDEDVPFVASRLMIRLIEPVALPGEKMLVRPHAGVAVAGSGQLVPEAGQLVRQALAALDEADAKGGGFAASHSPEAEKLLASIQSA